MSEVPPNGDNQHMQVAARDGNSAAAGADVSCVFVQAALAEEGVLLGAACPKRTGNHGWQLEQGQLKCPYEWALCRASGQRVMQVRHQLTSPPL